MPNVEYRELSTNYDPGDRVERIKKEQELVKELKAERYGNLYVEMKDGMLSVRGERLKR